MGQWCYTVMMKIQSTALKKLGQNMCSASKTLSQKTLDFTRSMLKRQMFFQLTFEVKNHKSILPVIKLIDTSDTLKKA